MSTAGTSTAESTTEIDEQSGTEGGSGRSATASFVVVANRLPVDRIEHADGTVDWRTSPGGLVTAFEDLVPAPAGAPQRVHTVTTDTAAFLLVALAAWAADGSLVVTRGAPEASVLEARKASEGVTATA